MHNAGQCCASDSRLIVHDSVEKALTDRILELMAKVRVGDSLGPETRVGTIVNET
ncbi:aldehyde dehydrogenase family protein [Mesorhizobium sp. M0292]|uniref:aldehyde dehydrogenase family protein n=1 Tax=Mesorhizobium sp. M0292 TaxID=2956929 RepID=UPI003337FCEB